MNGSPYSPETFGVMAQIGWSTGLKFLLTLAFLAALYALRWALLRLIRGGGGPLSDRQRWWMSLVRNLAVAAGIGGLVVIWAAEFEQFALSIAAVAVAFVIATKEIWLCLTGATWRAASQSFGVGDWIEIGGHSGEVIDENLLSTMIQEIDPHDYMPTGRLVSIPNSLLLSEPVVNHSFRKRFITLDFTLFSEPVPDPETVRSRIEVALAAAAADFRELAQRYSAVIERTAGVSLRDCAPAVALSTTDFAKLAYRVTVFCPRDRAAGLKAVAARALFAA